MRESPAAQTSVARRVPEPEACNRVVVGTGAVELGAGGWVVCGGRVRWGWVSFGGGATVVEVVVVAEVVVEFSTRPPNVGWGNGCGGRFLVASSMKLCQMTAGREPPVTSLMPWMWTSGRGFCPGLFS